MLSIPKFKFGSCYPDVQDTYKFERKSGIISVENTVTSRKRIGGILNFGSKIFANIAEVAIH